MSKKRKPAPKAVHVQPGSRSPVPKSPIPAPQSLEIPAFFKNTLLQSGLIFAFAFLLYANTLKHGFVLDDSIVITQNMFTEKGVDGIRGILTKDSFFGYFKVEGKAELVMGGRYRPLTLVLFALVYQLFGDSSFVFHLLSVLLFSVTCVVLYRTLLLLFRPRLGDTHGAMLSWMTAVLYAAHPIHAEVVANIKGCDETVTLLGSLGALYFTLKAFDSRKVIWGIAAGLSFFLACLSKENAVTFLVVIPLALWFFRPTNANEGKASPASPGSIAGAVIPVFIAFIAFFVIRGEILNWPRLLGGKVPMELMNNPFLKIEGNHWVPYTFPEKLATVLYTLWKYVQLLIVPHPLTHDYYPRQIGMMSFRDPSVLLSLAVYGFMVWYALSGIRRRDPLRFGILYYLLTLSIVSNLVFPVGTMMGDRFAFMPSVGFCIVASAVLLNFVKGKNRNLVLGIFGAVVLLYSLKTLTRNTAWESNEKLFFRDAEVSSNSAKIHNACGGILFDKAAKEPDTAKQKDLARQAIVHLNKAVEIHPTYKDAYTSRGSCNYLLRNFDAAIADYRLALKLSDGDSRIKTGLAMALRDGGKYYGDQKRDLAGALRLLSESWQMNTKDPETARLLGVANGVQGKHPDAIMWFAKAVELEPDNALFLYDLGSAYYASGDPVKGEPYHRKALEINPNIREERAVRR